MELPEEEDVMKRYLREVDKFIDRELYPQVVQLQEKIRESKENPKYINRIGILYARYGANEQAVEQFEKVLRQRDYLPALINMGNMKFLQDKMEEALDFFERAYRIKSTNKKVLLGLAKVSHELDRYEQVERYYSQLKKLDAALAERFSYLDLRGQEDTARALEVERMREVVVWEEE